MAWSDLKDSIDDVIKTNGNEEITGSALQQVLHSIIDSVGANATFKGVASTATNPGVPDGVLFYLASAAGVYSNFSGLTITIPGVYVLHWNGSAWSLTTVFNSVGTDTIANEAVTTAKLDDESVTIDKISAVIYDFLKFGYQDESSTELIELELVNATDGQAGVSVNFARTGYINCEGAKYIEVTMPRDETVSAIGIAFYTAASQATYISGSVRDVGLIGTVLNTYEIPSNAVYFRTTYWNEANRALYGEFSCKVIYSTNTETTVSELRSVFSEGRNLFEGSTIANYSINVTTGALTATVGRTISGFIPVTQGSYYYIYRAGSPTVNAFAIRGSETASLASSALKVKVPLVNYSLIDIPTYRTYASDGITAQANGVIQIPEGVNYVILGLDLTAGANAYSDVLIEKIADSSGEYATWVDAGGFEGYEEYASEDSYRLKIDNSPKSLEDRELLLSKMGLENSINDNSRNIAKKIFDKSTSTILDINENPVALTYFDRVSAIIEITGPSGERIIIAGLGARDYDAVDFPYDDTYLVDNCILRSTDDGQTWTAITPTNKTDRKIYGLSADTTGKVVAVTGDRNHPCIMSSVDYGLTWVTRVPTASTGTAALYNSYYSASRGRFLVPSSAGVFWSSNATNWSLDSYTLQTGRNGLVVSDLDEIWVAGNSISVLRSGDSAEETAIGPVSGWVFKSISYCGKGVFIATAASTATLSSFNPDVSYVEKTTLAARRKSNMLFLTFASAHGLQEDSLLSMNLGSDHVFYNTCQDGLRIKVIDDYTIAVYQKGEDVLKHNIAITVRCLAKCNSLYLRVYKSYDYGKTWGYEEITGFAYGYAGVWSRDVADLGDGTLYLSLPGHENEVSYNAGTVLKSVNWGKTWALTWDIADEGKLNAVYKSWKCANNEVLLGCQDNCRILKIF